MENEIRYIHQKNQHHHDLSPEIICPILFQFLKPKSVIDIGCGVGNFLREFKKLGVNEIKGLDGTWADKIEIDKNITLENFTEFNLDNIYNPEYKFDLAISLEVAEHINNKYADNFVKTLSNSSNNIVFSAAIPLQGGQNHLNEQWNEFWIQKFKTEGYSCVDFLKPLIWNQKEVFWWYKQNILFFTKNPERFINQKQNDLKNVIHPELFQIKTKELVELRKINTEYQKINEAGMPFNYYFSKIFTKIIRKF